MASTNKYAKCVRNVKFYVVLWIVVVIVSTSALDTRAGTVAGIGTVAPLVADTPVGSDTIQKKDFKKFESDPAPEYYK